MTEQEQRIAIAEAFPDLIGQSSSGAWMWKSSDGRWHPCYPDNCPLSDLNAMREAENTLNEIQGCIFCDNLFKILNSSDGVSEFMKVNTTAAQRAEAFLKTLNLWKP